MRKKLLRQTISQREQDGPLKAQPARDHAALILPITAIRMGKNVRSDLGDIQELIDSVIQHGIVQPLVVAKVAGGLELVAGYRRLEAAKAAGLVDVPVRVAGADENQIAVLRLVENIQREDLSGPDEIMAVAGLSAIFPDQVQLAKAIGKSKSYVSRCLKAAELIRGDRVATSQLTKSALFELVDKANPQQVLKEVGGRPATVKEVREKSGPLPGGRYGTDGCLTFNERKDGKAFSLRLNVDFDRTPAASRQQIIKTLEDILKKLRGEG